MNTVNPQDSIVFLTVRRIIVEVVGVEEKGVILDARLLADLMPDELDLTVVIMSLEQEFDILIDPEEEGEDVVQTVQDLVDLVKRKLAEKAAATQAIQPS